jgi:hypothetical protein
MKKLVGLLFLALNFCAYSQTYTIDETLINLTDECSVSDFYQNTYYNAIDSVDVSWQIIESTMPDEWSFSNCFPNCYNPGVTSGTSVFTANSQQYLNCHFYPNNTPGTGVVKMEITTNQQFIDTVTWIGVATAPSEIAENYFDIVNNEEVTLFDISGKRLNGTQNNQLNIILFSNGKFEKRYIIKQ